ncbi:centrosomal protein of 63 kDa-like [Actinia tenebrosa]|uniref:Centrosomal protein of 63 kDa-like n=1 Tax=Actinia tenebrosa TaxID=6105 RepID=A0A6P8I2V3_ACTTE|nr:centrosomal protein of 63 kDa-like [Actinia tenebrosa]
MNTHSPPKLTRIIGLDSSKFTVCQPNQDKKGVHNEEKDEESEFSLPALAGEVADAQKLQALEITNRQEVLIGLKVAIQEKIEMVRAEISSLARKVCVTEEEVIACQNKCKVEQKDIEKLIALQRTLTCQIKSERQQLDNDKGKFNEYFNKMDAHRLLVEEYESSSDIRKEISSLEKETKKLKEEIIFFRNGQHQDTVGIAEEYEILKTEISHLKQTRKEMEKEMEHIKLQIKSEDERQAQLKKEIHLLQKRNHAQLTRLQRQLQEALGRSRHWNEEACKLETSIAQLREKIEE